MTKPVSARDPERDESQNEFMSLVVPAGLAAAQCVSDLASQIDCPKIPVEQLKTRKTGELLIREFNLQISVDSVVDFAIS